MSEKLDPVLCAVATARVIGRLSKSGVRFDALQQIIKEEFADAHKPCREMTTGEELAHQYVGVAYGTRAGSGMWPVLNVFGRSFDVDANNAGPIEDAVRSSVAKVIDEALNVERESCAKFVEGYHPAASQMPDAFDYRQHIANKLRQK